MNPPKLASRRLAIAARRCWQLLKELTAVWLAPTRRSRFPLRTRTASQHYARANRLTLTSMHPLAALRPLSSGVTADDVNLALESRTDRLSPSPAARARASWRRNRRAIRRCMFSLKITAYRRALSSRPEAHQSGEIRPGPGSDSSAQSNITCAIRRW